MVHDREFDARCLVNLSTVESSEWMIITCVVAYPRFQGLFADRPLVSALCY